MPIKTKIKLLKDNPFILFDGEYICNGHWLLNSEYFTISEKSTQMLIDIGQPFKKDGGCVSHGKDILKKCRPLKEGIPDWKLKKDGYRIAKLLPLAIQDYRRDEEYQIITQKHSICCVINKKYLPILSTQGSDLMAIDKQSPVVCIKNNKFVSLLMPCDMKKIKEEVPKECLYAIDVVNKGLKIDL